MYMCFQVLGKDELYGGQAGVLTLESPTWLEEDSLSNAPFQVFGENAGDRLADTNVLFDLNADGSDDIVLGAPGTDAGGAGSGSLWLLPGPR